MTEHNIVIILDPDITIECCHLIKCLKTVLSECSGTKGGEYLVSGTLDNGLAQKEYWITDCSLASANILLAAKALGLGAIWTAGWPVAERVAHLRRILNIPATHMPLNVIPVGYAAENPPPKNKWKPERIHRDGWV